MVVDSEDATLQQIINSMLVITEKERAASILDLTERNASLSLIFEMFRRENLNFMESLHPEIAKY